MKPHKASAYRIGHLRNRVFSSFQKVLLDTTALDFYLMNFHPTMLKPTLSPPSFPGQIPGRKKEWKRERERGEKNLIVPVHHFKAIHTIDHQPPWKKTYSQTEKWPKVLNRHHTQPCHPQHPNGQWTYEKILKWISPQGNINKGHSGMLLHTHQIG